MHFQRVVSLALVSLLNEFLDLYNHFLNSPSAAPRYTLFGLSSDNTVNLYIMFVTWHWSFRGHSDFTLHLHGFNYLTSFLKTFLLRGLFYYAPQVLYARIAKLQSVSVSFENFVKFIRLWKVLIYEILTIFSYFGGNIFVKRWIEAN